ncbi:hypothetical protein BDW75DRAFT_1590 [Aspergillus navahoensis]
MHHSARHFAMLHRLDHHHSPAHLVLFASTFIHSSINFRLGHVCKTRKQIQRWLIDSVDNVVVALPVLFVSGLYSPTPPVSWYSEFIQDHQKHPFFGEDDYYDTRMAMKYKRWMQRMWGYVVVRLSFVCSCAVPHRHMQLGQLDTCPPSKPTSRRVESELSRSSWILSPSSMDFGFLDHLSPENSASAIIIR